ncbi:MAG: HNH endonuclease [Ruminococcus sp.]|nr:HNH endonuclease [Ruminococcus sp.]
MEFKTFFSMMKNRISDGADVPYFFKDLVAMITDVTEDEWGTPKDPSTKLSKESTLRSYAKRGLTKKFAESIVYRLTPENFVESLKTRPATVLELLADDYRSYDSSANADNIAELLANCFVEILRGAAGLVAPNELEKQKMQQAAADLKRQYGEFLIHEANHFCPFPGCGRSLTLSNDGKTMDSYEVCLIDKEAEPKLDNLIAVCPRCYATYSIDNNKKLCKELKHIKKLLETYAQGEVLIDDLPLEKGIIEVIGKIKKLKETDLADASFDPIKLRYKLPPNQYFALYNMVNNIVTTYYVKIKEIMISLDKRGVIDYAEVQDQMKAIYRRLKKGKKSRREIFNDIVNKIHRVSLQEEIYCQIVVAYFIENCEVFDAVTKYIIFI